MQSRSQSTERTSETTRRPLLAVLACVIGFAGTTVHNTLPGAFPVMFLRGDLRLGMAQVGVLSGILYVGMMIAGPLAGREVDSLGRKLPLVGSTLLMACATALMAVARDYPTLLAARPLCGLGAGGIIPLVYAYHVDVLPERWQGPSSLGMAAVGGGAASLATLFVVRQAMSYGPEGWRVAMWGFAGVAVLALVSFMLCVKSSGGKGLQPAVVTASVLHTADGGLWSDHQRALLALMTTTVFVAIMNSAFFVSVVPNMLRRGASETDALAVIGSSVAASILSLAIGALLSNRIPRFAMLSGACAISLLSLIVFTFSGSLVVATLGCAGTIFGTGLCFGALPFYAAEAVPEHLRGRLPGLFQGLPYRSPW